MTLVYLKKLVPQLPYLLQQVETAGVAVIPAALPTKLCDELCAELGTAEYRDRSMVFAGENARERVQQEFETLPLHYPPTGFPMVAELGYELELLVRACGGYFAGWRINDVAAQLYQTHHVGITKHRDFLRDRILVAVFSLCGIASFCTWDEQGLLNDPCLITTGSLVLLRAPALDENAIDNRLYHAIGSPIGKSRLSLAYRHNVSG
jgi:hypothetical protein